MLVSFHFQWFIALYVSNILECTIPDLIATPDFMGQTRVPHFSLIFILITFKSLIQRIFSNFILDEDVYEPYPCLCTSNHVYNLRAERCFNDPAIDCEPCSRSVCGSWSKWSSWSGCSRTCGGGERSRDRTFTWYDDRTFVEVSTNSCNTGKNT